MNDRHDTSTERLVELEQRLSKLAKEKSLAELINNLLTGLSTVRGLQNMVTHILNALMQTIGASNVVIVYFVKNEWLYEDIYGVSRQYQAGERPALDLALLKGQPHQEKVDHSTGEQAENIENWAFPLLVHDRIIGAVCMEGMLLTEKTIFDELLSYFVYAAAMLENEISNYAELEEAHSRLQDSETLYRTLFDQSPDGIVLWNLPDLQPLQFNTAAHTLLDYTREEFACLSVVDIHNSKDPEEIQKRTAELMAKKAISFEAQQKTKDQKLRTVLVSLKLIEISGKQVILSVHRDITAFKEAEEIMALMNFAMDHISEAAYLIDKDSNIKYVNTEATRALGYSKEELLEMCVPQLGPEFPIERWPEHWRKLESKKTQTFQTTHKRKDGTTFPVEVSANHFGYGNTGYNLALVADITERLRIEEEHRRFEDQMAQTQKMESLGVLAGGVAHDFNNLLAAIMGHSELSKRKLPPGSAAIENLKQIEQAAERAADLAKQMLAYSGRGKFVVETINPNDLLEEILHMLQVSISKKVVLRLSPHKPLPSVDADATQLRQIIMNLVINASEAIGEKSGVISITTGCMDCDQSYLRDIWLEENLSEGLYVYLEIADTGCGMDKDTLSKLFDPFFTTKFTGRGLGMSAVLGIVRGHGGAIQVYSETGKGTTFKILLPASEKSAELFNGDKNEENWTGTGHVLLVDDEETVRGIGIEMLKELGFEPLTACDGREALEKFEKNSDISLVILDLTMPKMDGVQCYRELKRIRADVKVIISSGYSEYEVSQKFTGKGISGFLQKPYKLSALREAIKHISGQ